MPLLLRPGLSFYKMHGLSNDFILIPWQHLPTAHDPALSDMVRTLCHRQRGIGADGLVVVAPPTHPSCPPAIAMRYWNADGSWAEQCVNALRCVALYHQQTTAPPFLVHSAVGEHSVTSNEDGISVSLGLPIWEPSAIPVHASTAELEHLPHQLSLQDLTGWATAVSMGNPHLIIEVAPHPKVPTPVKMDLSHIPLDRWADYVEQKAWFPQGVNVTAAYVHSPDHIQIRTWERGVGLTAACGSAAAATAVAMVLRNRCATKVRVQAPGGNISISWPTPTSPVYLTGAAEFVYKGTWLGPAGEEKAGPP